MKIQQNPQVLIIGNNIFLLEQSTIIRITKALTKGQKENKKNDKFIKAIYTAIGSFLYIKLLPGCRAFNNVSMSGCRWCPSEWLCPREKSKHVGLLASKTDEAGDKWRYTAGNRVR